MHASILRYDEWSVEILARENWQKVTLQALPVICMYDVPTLLLWGILYPCPIGSVILVAFNSVIILFLFNTKIVNSHGYSKRSSITDVDSFLIEHFYMHWPIIEQIKSYPLQDNSGSLKSHILHFIIYALIDWRQKSTQHSCKWTRNIEKFISTCRWQYMTHSYIFGIFFIWRGNNWSWIFLYIRACDSKVSWQHSKHTQKKKDAHNLHPVVPVRRHPQSS
jgi:hypothetical protein